jgi:murein DD-endopeptidase MepM/ murein hydrolase activator NlpD
MLRKAFNRKGREEMPQRSQRTIRLAGFFFVVSANPSRALWLKALGFVLALTTSLPAGVQIAAAQVVSWQPAKLVNGSPVLFTVSIHRPVKSLRGSWLGHELTFFQSAGNGKWYALAGAPVETAPGNYRLKLQEDFANGKSTDAETTVRISRATYPKITVHVAKQYTEPNPEQLRQINADKEVKEKTFGTSSQQRFWNGPFVAPVPEAISDVFGTARVFNDEVQSRHLGLDFAAPAGTPVHAINRGTVILARPLYFEGGFIVIDHGQGLMSLYLHLSEFNVKEGDKVDTGQLIALSGGSGRATGPHLHLAIRWQGVYLNPAILLKMRLPSVAVSK